MENVTHMQAPQLIGYSAKIGGGKDLATKITQYLTCEDEEIREQFLENPVATMANYDGIIHMNSRFENKKYASKVKFIVATLLGVTINELENKSFIDLVLPEIWWYYIVDGEKISYLDEKFSDEDRPKLKPFLVKLTPRKMMQLVGTEAGREIIHPDVWINATFSDYVESEDGELPHWIVSDVRFPNELNRIHNMGGVSIRIIRTRKLTEWLETYHVNLPNMDQYHDVNLTDLQFTEFMNEFESDSMGEVIEKLNHASETSLDDGMFHYTINNDSTVANLVNEIYTILLEVGVITEQIKVEA